MDKEYLAGLFAEQTTAQKYRLEQYTQEELIKLYTALNRVQDDILRRWGKSIKTEWSQTRAVGMIEEARGLMNEIKPKIEGSIASTLGHISSESASVYSEMLTFGGKAKAAKTAILSAEQMAAYWKTTPVGGHLLNDWVNRTFDGPTIEAIQREVFAGMFQGEGYPKMIKRLQEGFTLTKREAETLVRTYVHTANVHAMKEVYGKNRDVIAGVRWLTALDERTCMRCAALAGKLYPLDDHPPCPLHPRCRCVLIPETNIKKLKVSPKVAKDWKDGLDTQVPDLDKVVTPDGIPKMDFRAWIMSRPERDQLAFFGPTRFKMLKEGKIGWGDLVDPDTYRLKTLAELQGRTGASLKVSIGEAEVAARRAGQKLNQELKEMLQHEAMVKQLDDAAIKKAKAKAAAISKGMAEAKKNLDAYIKAKIAGVEPSDAASAAFNKLGAKKQAAALKKIEEGKQAERIAKQRAAEKAKKAEERAAAKARAEAKAKKEAERAAAAKAAAEAERQAVKAEKKAQQALEASMKAPDEVTTFTKDMPGSGMFKPIDKPDLLKTEVWEPILPDGKKSTGAIVFDEETGKVYLVKPKGGFGGYQQTFPKGQMEAGLTAQKNAIKEVWEEAGLDIEILDYLGGYKKTTSTSHYYVARVRGGSPAAFLTNETEAVLLVPQGQLKKYLNMAVDQKIADDFMAAYNKAVTVGKGNASAGFQALNAEKKAKAAVKAQSVAKAKKEAEIIKKVLKEIEDGTFGVKPKWDNISVSLYNKGIKDAEKAKRVGKAIAAKVEKKKLVGLKDYATKNADSLFGISPTKADLVKYFQGEGISLAGAEQAATDVIKEWAEAAAAKAAKEAAEAAAKKAAADAARAARKAAEAEAAKKAAEAAKKSKKVLGNKTLDGGEFTLYKGQKGSNKGGFYRNNKTGEEYYFKFPNSDTHIDNEILASKLYREAGINVPELTDVIMPDGRRALASKVVSGITENKAELVKAGSSMNKAAKKSMAIDAWLGNWDVVGLGYDNLVVDAAGKIYHIDVGGSLLFRAQGLPKGAAFGNVVGELESFLNSAVNPQSASVFRGITRKELIAGVKKVAAISDERIVELVKAYGPRGREQELIDTLIARKRDLLAKFPEAAPKGKGAAKVAPVKPKASGGDRTKVHYGPADDDFAADVNRLGVQGKSIPTDAGDIEDQNVLVFVQELANGERQTVVKLKLRPGVGASALENTLTTLNSNSMGSLGIKSAKVEQVKVTKRRTVGGKCEVVDDDVPLCEMYRDKFSMEAHPGEQHTVVYADGTRMRYIPKGDRYLYALHGEIEITIPGGATKEGINGALARLGKLGVDTTPSTALNSELMYLDKMIYLKKYHTTYDPAAYLRKPDAEWEAMVNLTRGKSIQEQIDARAKFLSKRMGVPDIRKMPDYDPDGVYQTGILGGAKDAGQRLQLRCDLTQEMLDKEMDGCYLVHGLTNGGMSDSLEAILKGNGSMISTVDKIRQGIPASGLSPAQDTKSGGANYFFTRIANMLGDKYEVDEWKKEIKGGCILFKKDMLRRMDAISYPGDKFGETTPGFVEKWRRSDIDGFKECSRVSRRNETIFKQNVTLVDNIECFAANNQEEADKAIALFRKYLGGDTFPDGRRIEDVVMTATQWLKKMGY